MFLSKYLNETYYNEIINNYKEEFLGLLDEVEFKKIYDLFRENNFSFIEDIILKYLEIFIMDYDDVKTKLEELKKMLGSEYIKLISSNMQYLNYILS